MWQEINQANLFSYEVGKVDAVQESIKRPLCSRCGGLLVSESCFDLEDQSGQIWFEGQRCLQCGDIVDPVILKNRLGLIQIKQQGPKRRWPKIQALTG